YESDIKGDCFLDVNGFESMMIQASWIRSRKGHEINMSSDEQFALMKTLSYRSVEFSVQKLAILGMEISPKEAYYITSLFLGIQTTGFTSQEEEDTYISNLAEQLIYNFERIACISFPNRERLHSQLSHHIRPMFYRLKYGITAKNPLTKDITRMYPVVYDFTRRAMQEIETKMMADISEDELAYLCVYFASNLSEKFISQNEASTTEEVLIIGADNMATATLVKEQLQDLFGLSFRYSVITVDRLHRWELNDYALVVSLVPLGKQLGCKKLVETGPILTEANQQKIMDVIKKNPTIARHDALIQDIIRIAGHNLNGTLLSERLYFELFRYFDQREGSGGLPQTTETFPEKMTVENISVLPEGIGWDNTVLQGAVGLQSADGNGRLVSKMHNLLHHKKVQIYRFHPEIVLVHYPMQGELDSKVDVRILVSRGGVVCQDGQKAQVILCLATCDRYTHWNMLQEIFQYFRTADHLDGVKQMCFTREEKIV
ncbi:MAG: PRD domain-containing protein, partial [Pseudoflavonifractor sp.]